MRFWGFTVWSALLGLAVAFHERLVPILGWLFIVEFALVGLLLAVGEVGESRARRRQLTEDDVLRWLEENAGFADPGVEN